MRYYKDDKVEHLGHLLKVVHATEKYLVGVNQHGSPFLVYNDDADLRHRPMKNVFKERGIIPFDY